MKLILLIYKVKMNSFSNKQRIKIKKLMKYNNKLNNNRK